MPKFTKEQIHTSYDALPESLREHINSNESVDRVRDIAKSHHLIDERANQVASVVGYLILGLIHPEDLQKAIAEEAQIDPRVAKEITDAINAKVIPPMAEELNKHHGFHIATPHRSALSQSTLPTPPIIEGGGPPQKTSPETEEAQPAPPTLQQQTPPPTDIPPAAQVMQQEASPFVMHEHQGQDQASSPQGSGYEGGLVRPSFYSPDGTTQQATPLTARLEIGGDSNPDEPHTVRLGKEDARVVHYSAPQTPADPFAPKNTSSSPQPQPEQPKQGKEVHPDNVVDLKDLPQ